jgi:hypothetical protein
MKRIRVTVFAAALVSGLLIFQNPVYADNRDFIGKWEQKGGKHWIEVTPDLGVNANFMIVMSEQEETYPPDVNIITEEKGSGMTY